LELKPGYCTIVAIVALARIGCLARWS